MQEITFTQAAILLLEKGETIIFKADNNRNPEQPGFQFRIYTFEDLCEEYKQLYKDYTNIKLYASTPPTY
jgi:hypothetical protein